MNCKRCKSGRSFLDRVFTDNTSFEVACLHCGQREYINKDTDIGKWLSKLEVKMERIQNGLA